MKIIMIYFAALLFGLLAYVIVKFLLKKVPSLADLAELAAIIVGFLVALLYVGVLR